MLLPKTTHFLSQCPLSLSYYRADMNKHNKINKCLPVCLLTNNTHKNIIHLRMTLINLDLVCDRSAGAVPPVQLSNGVACACAASDDVLGSVRGLLWKFQNKGFKHGPQWYRQKKVHKKTDKIKKSIILNFIEYFKFTVVNKQGYNYPSNM